MEHIYLFKFDVLIQPMNKSKTVTPYGDGASKKAQIEKMFDNVAWRYDILNRALSMGVDIAWRKKLIKQLKSYNPSHILDMATGTADLAVMAARKIPGSHITGIDLSTNMIKMGLKKVVKKDLKTQVTLKTGDSENIQHENDTFDASMVAFGVRNFENLELGLSELYRVSKPGAPLFILEFSKPTIFPIKQLFNLYFNMILPVIGKVFSKDQSAYRYLYESVQAFPDYGEMQKIMEGIGFKNCRWESLSFGICCLYVGEK
ncbi:MAG: demethylmenaquinone methyltransferase/2-methoxy-6-polyprenyl-1,4-benzoquinol methylase [Saprospiraceae bacterium]